MKQGVISLQKYFSTRNRLLLLFSFVWSWLLLVDIGRMANSIVVGYGALLIIYALLVSISTYVVMKAIELHAFSLEDSWRSIAKVVICWAAIELLLAWFLVAIFWGAGSSWDDIAPFGSLTPLVMNTPLKFLTRFFGYFGTSAVVGTGILLLFNVSRWRKKAILYWTVLFGLCVTSYLLFRVPSGPEAHVTIMSEKLGEPQGQINTDKTQFVLFPEYGLDKYESTSVHERFRSTNEAVFFSGTKLVINNEGTSNVLIYGTNSNGYEEEHVKSRLIVGGEFMPYIMEMSLKYTAPVVYDDFMLRRAVRQGSDSLKTFAIGSGVIVGNAACSSIMNPDDYRQLTSQGATILANSASLEIFRGSRLFGMYHDGFAKFMATANARPFLQSANDWKAFALDHNGATIVSVNPTSTREVTIQTNSRKTPYVYLGEWVAVVGGIFLFFSLVRVLTEGIKHKKLPKKV